MERSRRVVILAHCILNANVHVDGLAVYRGARTSVVRPYLDEGIGIIQLPCPEVCYLGNRRWGMTREQYDTPSYRRHCREALRPVVDTLESLDRSGYELVAVVGVDGSPSCGVDWTAVGYCGGEISDQMFLEPASEARGTGVMIEELRDMLEERKVDVVFSAVEHGQYDLDSLPAEDREAVTGADAEDGEA